MGWSVVGTYSFCPRFITNVHTTLSTVTDDKRFRLFIIYGVIKALNLKLTKFIDTVMNKLGLTTR